ncbi:MAG: 7-cyano-7-deazaguanine synthase [Burkholderiales bacterium]|nr:7-cyano-7-deazaguanine synthase [Burkholderiales bacterium]
MTPDARHALVLFSGGQDSATCLAWALSRHAVVETIGFDYGQRHHVELDCRARLRDGLRRMCWPGVLGEDHLLHVGVLKELGASAMTDDVAIVLHDWGYGCGACPACQLRARGWAGWAGQRNAGG